MQTQIQMKVLANILFTVVQIQQHSTNPEDVDNGNCIPVIEGCTDLLQVIMTKMQTPIMSLVFQ